MQVYINTKKTSISAKNKSFFIKNEETKQLISPKKISSIAILSNANIKASAIKLAAKNDIPLLYYDYTGNLIAQLRSPDFLKHARLRQKQLQFMKNEEGIQWALQQIQLKTVLQIQTLERLVKEKPKAYEQVNKHIQSIKDKKQTLSKLNLKQNKVQNSIMGIEGGIARVYYKALNVTLKKPCLFNKRSRMPGKDYFNTALNYLYGMTYSQVGRAIEAAGLDSFVGAIHTTPFRESLVYDMIEFIRPIIDRLLLQLCKEQLLLTKHFTPIKNGYWLSKEGKKLILPHYASYLQERIKINGKVRSIQNHIYWRAKELKIIIQNS